MEKPDSTTEIPLKNIVLFFLKEWKIILSFTLTAVLIAVLYIYTMAVPAYSASVNGTFITPVAEELRYGKYTFPTTNISDYISEATSGDVLEKTIQELNLTRSADELKSSVTISAQGGQNRFVLTVQDISPEAATNLVKTISEVFIQEINVKYRQYAVKFFLKDTKANVQQYDEELQNEEMKLQSMEEELADVSPVITLKKLLEVDPVKAAELASEKGLDITKISGEKIELEEVINPRYSEIEKAIVEIKVKVEAARVDAERNNILYKALQEESSAIDEYYETGDFSGFKDETLNVLESNIFISDSRIAVSQVAPRKKFILIFAVMIGVLLGAIAAFSKSFFIRKKRVVKTSNV